MKLANHRIQANDKDDHAVCWMRETHKWTLFKGLDVVREHYHLCNALTDMHYTICKGLPEPEYRDHLVKNWTIE